MNLRKIVQIQEAIEHRGHSNVHEDEQGDARNLSISLKGKRYKIYLTTVFLSFFFFFFTPASSAFSLPGMDNVETKLVDRRPSASFRSRVSILLNMWYLPILRNFTFHPHISSRGYKIHAGKRRNNLSCDSNCSSTCAISMDNWTCRTLENRVAVIFNCGELSAEDENVSAIAWKDVACQIFYYRGSISS